jgi:hypothetical protein
VDGDGGGGGLLGLRRTDGGGGGLKELPEAVAELGNGVAEGEQAVEQDGAGEMKGVAGGVDAAFEGCGLLAAEGQRDGGKVEAAGVGCGWSLAAVARGAGGGRRCGLEQEIAQRNGSMVKWVNLQGLVGELKFAGERWLGRKCCC